MKVTSSILFYGTFLLCTLFFVAQLVNADIYMHNPRGSNSRNCEKNANRNNANLICDTQNNAAGGYACPRKLGGPDVVTPRMYYYEGSELKVEWTSQHSCGRGNAFCETVIQYMCNDTKIGETESGEPYYQVRYGIPNNDEDSATETVTTETNYDRRSTTHEPMDYWKKCDTRDRNKGLYISDRNLNRNRGARATRQNNNGNRHGWECPEERDYYPYWHWAPWIDIAVFTGNTSRCAWYKENSQNVKPRHECWLVEEIEKEDGSNEYKYLEYLKYNNEKECKENDGHWREIPSWGIEAPECLSSDLINVRDNHLGNSDDGYAPSYTWKIPYVSEDGRSHDSSNVVPEQKLDEVDGKAPVYHQNCVLRIRYNISTEDTPWEIDSRNNGDELDRENEDGNPMVQDPWNYWGYDHHIMLAVNSNQYGRTFQDRSYVFEIRERPEDVPMWATIHNLNVRGKRGNIVQVYPSVEYDFVPSNLAVTGSDYVHIQWTGTDYNPNRTPNNAEGGPSDNGAYRSDRSNIVQIDVHGDNIPRDIEYNTMFLNDDGTVDKELVHKLAFMGQDIEDSSVCLTMDGLKEKYDNNRGEIELSDYNCGNIGSKSKGPYFDAGLVKMRANGKFHYMSSRNNNFSNRAHKHSITVTGAKFSDASTITVSTLCIVASFIVALLF